MVRPAFLRKASHEGVWSRDTRGLQGRIKPDASFSYSLSQRVLFDMPGDLDGQFRHLQNVTNGFPQAPRHALGRAC
jgi:hypothetical protein